MGGGFLCVKAYRNSLPPGERGIEFTTSIAPDPRYSTPSVALWYYPATPGVTKRTNEEGDDFAAIPATVVNMQP
jgi:hypothetical protein